VAVALEGQLEPPQKRPRSGEHNTFAGLRPPVGKEALERHNDMMNDYRQALQDIHAETKRGRRKATTAATANQEAFRKFVVEQPQAFRLKTKSGAQGGMEEGMLILAH